MDVRIVKKCEASVEVYISLHCGNYCETAHRYQVQNDNPFRLNYPEILFEAKIAMKQKITTYMLLGLAFGAFPISPIFAADAIVSNEPELSNEEFEERFDSGWSITFSGGVILAPRFLGDDDYEASAFPNINIEYGDLFFASLNGVGFNIINHNGLKAGPIAKYDFGRDETESNPFGFGGDPNNDLVGLGDIDGSVEVGGFIEYTYENIETRLEVRQGLDGGHEGMIAEASIAYADEFAIGEVPVFWALGPTVAYGDETYNSAFFDVNATQSAASGLAQYDADAGLISYGLEGRIVLPVTEQSALVAFGGVDFLGEELADSSLVQQRGSDVQSTFGLMLTYKLK